VRHPDQLRTLIIASYFNPRTREGCDEDGYTDKHSYDISIHAPVKGATRLVPYNAVNIRYFNPRTREGCDFAEQYADQILHDFNPRTREGCDPIGTNVTGTASYFNPRTREGCDVFTLLGKTGGEISIHAPVKGAT